MVKCLVLNLLEKCMAHNKTTVIFQEYIHLKTKILSLSTQFHAD